MVGGGYNRSEMPLFLGLDCGGTSTRAMVVDDDEKVVFEGKGGPANLATTPVDTIRASLVEATTGMPNVDATVGCFAGLLGAERHRLALELLSEITPNSKKTAHPDYVAALAVAPEGTDVVVIAGTGSMVCSWCDGEPVKTGGGGPILGDDGSAFNVGQYALRWFCLYEPKEKMTEGFTSEVVKRFGTDDRAELVATVNGLSNPAPAIASLASAVGQDSLAGHSYAKGAVIDTMFNLYMLVDRHVHEFHPRLKQVKLELFGGLWEASPAYLEHFVRFLKSSPASGPTSKAKRQYHVERLDAPPVLGAARLAKSLFYEH